MLKYSIKLNNSINSSRNVPIWLSNQVQVRNQQSDAKKAQSPVTFQNEVKLRQLQAKRSIFVESSRDDNAIREFTAYCSRIGRVQNFFRTDVDSSAYFLVEFDQSSVPTDIIRTAFHSGNHLVDGKIRTKGRFLYFNPKNEPMSKSKQLNYKRETNLSNRESILKAMIEEISIDDQIRTLYRVNQLSDLSSRLRFLTALQIEEAISGIFHNPQVLPFGSSINGFGRMQSDLDMILISCGNKMRKNQFSSIELGKPDDISRNNIRNNLFVLNSIARHWLQGVTEVTPVLNARVPIVKYVHKLTQLECDLSMGNYSGFQMSEMLHTFGELDERVRPLVFYIRAWAKEFDIIQSFPSLGISNFMLTCLVIFFLQRRSKPILPPSDLFVKHRLVNDDIQFITDVAKLNFKSENTNTLAELLVEFFEYYRTFNYTEDAASIMTGTVKANISQDSIYVYNPLDSGLNVCRNVSDFERNQFIEKCAISHKALTSDQIDAVGLLQMNDSKQTLKQVGAFINSTMKKDSRSNKQNSNLRKFDVKTLMKTR